MRNSQGKVPTWAIVLIGVAVVAFVGIVVVVASVGTWITKIGKEASDPAHAKKIAQDIVTIAEPLPPQWEIQMGMDAGGWKMCTIGTKSRTVVVSLNRYPKMLVKGDNIMRGQISGAKITVDERGERTVGGRQFSYVRGTSHHGFSFPTEMGYVKADNGDLITFQTMEPRSKTFDLELVQPFYESIKGFPAAPASSP